MIRRASHLVQVELIVLTALLSPLTSNVIRRRLPGAVLSSSDWSALPGVAWPGVPSGRPIASAPSVGPLAGGFGWSTLAAEITISYWFCFVQS